MISKTLLFLAALAAALVLGYSVYKWQLLYVSPRYMVAYYGFPAAVFATALVGLAWRPARTTIAFSLVSVLVALIAFELYLGLAPDTTNKTEKRLAVGKAAAAARGRQFDERVLSTVIAQLRSEGFDAYPVLSPTQWLYDMGDGAEWSPPVKAGNERFLPLSGVANARAVYCNEGGEWLIFDSDRFGFNNPPDIWEGSTVDLVIIGDSFAQGACVPAGRSAADIIRRKEPATLNLGIAGSGPLLQLAALKEFAAPRQPAAVIWFFFEGNDLNLNLMIEQDFEYLRRYLDREFRLDLDEKAGFIDVFLRDYVDTHLREMRSRDLDPVKITFNWREAVKLIRLRDLLGLTRCPPRDQNFMLYRRVIAEGRRMIESWGGKLYVAYLPASGGCDMFDPAAPGGHWLYRGVRDAVEQAGAGWIDLQRAFAADGDPARFYYYPGSHFSELVEGI